MRRLAWRGVAVAALLLPSLVAAQPWLQWAATPEHTGVTTDPGPEWKDIAYALRLPAPPAFLAVPILKDGILYVLTGDTFTEVNQTQRAIFRIDLDTGTGADKPWVKLEDRPYTWASDGEHLYVAAQDRILAVDMETGELGGAVVMPSFTTERGPVPCVYMQIAAGTIYALCVSYGHQDETLAQNNDVLGVTGGSVETVSFMVAIDAKTMTLQWVWKRDVTSIFLGQSGPSVTPPVDPSGVPVVGPIIGPLVNNYVGGAPGAAFFAAFLNGIAVLPDAVIFTVNNVEGPGGVLQCGAYGIDRTAGTTLWELHASPVADGTEPNAPSQRSNRSYCDASSEPTGTSDYAFMTFHQLLAVSPKDGGIAWRRALDDFDAQEDPRNTTAVGAGLALRDDILWTASKQSLYKIDIRQEGKILVQRGVLTVGRQFSSNSLLLAGDTLYGSARPAAGFVLGGLVPEVFGSPETNGTSLLAFDAQTLETKWELDFNDRSVFAGGTSGLLGIEGRLLARVDGQGGVQVIGRTSASLQPKLDVGERYPASGQEVHVEVTVKPGKFGAATEFRADWGDGTVDDWRPTAAFTHAYNDEGEGDYVARFEVRNEAGQTSSQTVTYHVNGEAPSLIERAFSSERQNFTFFFLGLAVTVIGAFVGAWRLRRRRTLLKRELRAIDEAFRTVGLNTWSVESVAAERRSRLTGLHAVGRIDDAQLLLLERHVTAALAGQRTRRIDEDLAFLPHRVALQIKSLLTDGLVSAQDRSIVDAVLAKEKGLTGKERARVRALVDGWFRADR